MTKNNQKITEDWNIKKLGEMGKFVSGGTPDTEKPEYWNGDIIWLTPSEITKLPTRFVSDSERKITRAGLKNSSAVLLPVGSLIICTRATVGDCCINIKEVSTNQGFKNLIPENSNIDFLYYLISSHKTDLIRKACGSTFLEISKHDIEKLKYSVPPLSEQEKIAEILGTWDLAIEKLEALIAAKRLRKKGLMQKLLTAKIRLPGFTDEWQKVKLGSICIFETAKSKSSSINENGKYYIVDMGAVSIDGSLIPTKTTDLKEDLLNINDVIMPKDDIGGGNIIGKTTIIKKENAYVLSDHVFKLKIHDADALFVSYLINSFQCNKYMRRMSNGSAVLGLAKKDVEKCSLCLPTAVSEQKAIASILSKADEEIDLLTRKLSALKEQKTGLMQKLLTGKIRVKVA